MSSQLLPVTQIEALPVQTIAGTVSGDVYQIGNRVVRYFDPPRLWGDTVLDNVIVGAPNRFWFLATPWLDLSCCTLVEFMLCLTTKAVSPPAFAGTLYVQYRTGPLDNPGYFNLTGGQRVEVLNGTTILNTLGSQFVAAPINTVQRQVVTWGGSINGAPGQMLAFGRDQRFLFAVPNLTSNNNPGDLNTYAAYIWAT